MEKREIYEHLARIYLDASLRYKKKRKYPKFLFILFFFIIGIIGLLYIFKIFSPKTILPFSQVGIILIHEPVKINFNFDPIKKEVYTIQFNDMNLEDFKTLSFRIKKNNFYDNINLRVEFCNNLRETASIYLTDISTKWKEFKVNLSDFKGISNWSKIRELMFIVEQWNTSQKNGKLYLDDIKILK